MMLPTVLAFRAMRLVSRRRGRFGSWGGGTVAPTVDVTPATGTHTISAVGLNGDTLGYVYRSFSGDGEITARVTRLAGGPAAGAGLMFRSSTDGNAAYLFVYLNGSGGVKFMRRAHIGVGTLGGNAQGPAGSWPPPVWLKVARSGSLFRAFTSQDGLAWTFVGDASTSGFGDSALAGMGVVSFSSTQRATAEFDSVDVGSLPSAWEPRLVGSGAGGSTKFDQGSNTFTPRGWGVGIAGTADSFSGALRPVLGDGELVAKVTGPVGAQARRSASCCVAASPQMRRMSTSTSSPVDRASGSPGGRVRGQPASTPTGGLARVRFG